MFIEDYFDKIFCINLDRRADRWQICLDEFAKFNITKFERFSAVDDRFNGNRGCTTSHKKLLDIIVANKWERTLILEDDFKIITEDFHAQFEHMITQVPEDWDMLYLGGHYGEPPEKRVATNVIKHKRMLTTSSYGVTAKMAKVLSDGISEESRHIAHTVAGKIIHEIADNPENKVDILIEHLLTSNVNPIGPIDSLFGQFHPIYNCYIFHPRLIVQREGFSDLQERVMNNEPCMMDTNHENMV